MKNILAKHLQLQIDMEAAGKTTRVGELSTTRGESIHFLREMSHFLNMELLELEREFAKAEAGVKPWRNGHEQIVSLPHGTDCRTKEESMDCLCFIMNILLASGITPENIDSEYDKIHTKIRERLDESY